MCGSLDNLFDDVSLPEVDPKWSMLETLNAFEDAMGRSSHFRSHISKKGLKFARELMSKMKEWIHDRLVYKIKTALIAYLINIIIFRYLNNNKKLIKF